MLLTPPDMERLENCSRFEKQIGGSEFNVAACAENVGAGHRHLFPIACECTGRLCEAYDSRRRPVGLNT